MVCCHQQNQAAQSCVLTGESGSSKVGSWWALEEQSLPLLPCRRSSSVLDPPRTPPQEPHQPLRKLESTLVSLLRACSIPRTLFQIEAQVLTTGLYVSRFLTPNLLSAAFRSGRPNHARLWLSLCCSSAPPATVVWNIMVRGHTEAGAYRDALTLFAAMLRADAKPDTYSFTYALKSCAKACAVRFGAGLHGLTARLGFGDSVFVGTGLVDVYSATGMVQFSRRVFNEMPVRNAVAWTSMVAAYVETGYVAEARRVFDQAPEEDQDVVMRNTLLLGYLMVGDVVAMREIFDQMPSKDLTAWNTMLSGYVKAGPDLRSCLEFFDQMPDRNVFSWNGLIDALLRHDQFAEALSAFSRMLECRPPVEPNEVTLVTVVSAITRLGALEHGIWVDAYGCKKGFGGSINFSNSLIDMYAKCGSIDRALKVFHSIVDKDVITWNAMIGGLAFHGLGPEVLRFFEQMKSMGHVPDAITFISVLSACSQKRLVKEGLFHFRSMNEVYRIKPSIKHYGCMVDLLGRAGFLDEALQFVKDMPLEADCIIWSSLQAAAVLHRDVNLAEMAMEQLVRLQPVDASNYVALSNIYGSFGRWQEYAWLKKKMRERNSTKVPGCSSIEVKYQVFEFCSSDVSHPRTQQIYDMIETLTNLLKLDFCGPQMDHLRGKI